MHLNNFVSYMKNQGVELYAISVQNEPDYGATAGWGSWSADACHDFALKYGAQITTKLMSCESFNYKKSYCDPILNDPAALANVAVLGTHLYGTTPSAYAYPLFDSEGAGKERWMTEHYTDSTTDANSWPVADIRAIENHVFNPLRARQQHGVAISVSRARFAGRCSFIVFVLGQNRTSIVRAIAHCLWQRSRVSSGVCG